MTNHRHRVTQGIRGFTLLEVVISMGILALLAASVYAITSSSISASRTAMDQQLSLRRLDSFLRVTRNAFLNLPGQGLVTLRIGKDGSGEAEQQLILSNVQGIFGLPSLGGGSLVLAFKRRPDGNRRIAMLRIPSHADDRSIEAALAGPGVTLMPKVRKPKWTFLSGTGGSGEPTWLEEWPQGSPRPSLVRLQMELEEIPAPVEAVFFVPQVPSPDTTVPQNQPQSSPTTPPPPKRSP